MNNTAIAKRTSLLVGATVLVMGMSACAGKPMQQLPERQDVEVADQQIADAFQAVSPEEAVSSEGITKDEGITSSVLASAAEQPIGIQLNAGSTFDQVVIASNGTPLDYRVSKLSNPARLVVDVLNVQTRVGREYSAEDNQFIEGVRLGAHPNKSRVVLDLSSEGLAHSVDASTGDVVVTLATEADMDRVIASLQQAEIGEQPTTRLALNDVEPSEAIAPIADIAIQEEAAELPAIQRVADTELKIGASKAAPQLEGLEFFGAPGSRNGVVAKMNSAGYFSLQKTAPSEYVLRLEGATFSPERVGTLLAPRGEGVIRSARAAQEGNDTLVRIFVESGTELSADSRNGAIVVKEKSSSTFAKLPDEARAQLSPEGEEAAESEGEAAAEEVESSNGDIDDAVSSLLEEEPRYTGRLISLDLQDTDIDNALRIIAEVSNLNIIASDDVTGKVTLRLIDVPWDQALDVILKTNGLDKVQEGSVVRIAPVEKLRLEREALKQAKEAEEELEPLGVQYIRVSYARAADLQDLVETVLSERGTVAYDERTNQIIVKDIGRGIKNVAKLVKKLDLRTPQVLLETQIVEAQRTLLRELGSELRMNHLQTPETGNATGYNFPNSIATAAGSAFSAPGVSVGEGSAVNFLLDSADGTVNMDLTLSALEREGRVRIVSRPAVATTNNQPATIKSVEKLRVKTPDGGTSVATGSGASAAGGGGVATETIEIGIVLEVTPQASPDYYVLLDVDAKSSTLGSTLVDGIPSEIERSATSTVLVSSGQTFALGGIYKLTDQSRLNGVPWLKDIPFIGHFFRLSQVDNSDEELIFFITPRIIEGSFDDAAMRVSS